MGFLDKILEKTNRENLIFEGVQTQGYKGYKKIYMIVYNGEDTTNFDNAEKLRKKYGDDFIGATIKIKKGKYADGDMIRFFVDDLIVGVLFPSYDDYKTILNNNIEAAYCKAEEETVIVKGKIRNKTVTRTKVKLLLKYAE